MIVNLGLTKVQEQSMKLFFNFKLIRLVWWWNVSTWPQFNWSNLL